MPSRRTAEGRTPAAAGRFGLGIPHVCPALASLRLPGMAWLFSRLCVVMAAGLSALDCAVCVWYDAGEQWMPDAYAYALLQWRELGGTSDHGHPTRLIRLAQ
jgi:hypothetical protein